MKKIKKLAVTAVATSLIAGSIPAAFADSTASSSQMSVPQGVGSNVLQNASVFGNTPGDTHVTIDIMMKVQNKSFLAQYINQTVNPHNKNYHNFLSVDQFAKQFGADPNEIKMIQAYLGAFGITTTVYPDNLVITANGTVDQFNKAFSVVLQTANYNGKTFHMTKANPKVPSKFGNDILCILGLTDYSNLTSRAVKQPAPLTDSPTPTGPLNLSPSDLIKQYNVQPLYDKKATGAGQTIGIVTLAGFNPEDAYAFWSANHIDVKPNRITLENIDGNSPESNPSPDPTDPTAGGYWAGYDETTLDVEQSGALAPQADIKVYVGQNSDTGFVDAWATAINENKADQLSVSWGESEPAIDFFVQQQLETPQYAEAFNQLFMQSAAQGISTFAASGDEGAYDAAREFGITSGIQNATSLSVDNPADSPYITAAGGTTLPFHFHSSTYNVDVSNDQERAWGWDYLYQYFDARGLNDPTNPKAGPDWATRYLVGGGGGFSYMFPTPDYQIGVPGVNKYTAVKQWTENADQSSLTRDAGPTIVTGNGSGRNMPDLSMNADPYTGYLVYFSDPGAPGSNSGYATYGGTSFVAPQLNGLSALINSANNTKRTGFWNPQIYGFATSKNSPFQPLNTTGTNNDNGFYTGTPGTVYNQATGLGTPDIAKLANRFAGK